MGGAKNSTFFKTFILLSGKSKFHATTQKLDPNWSKLHCQIKFKKMFDFKEKVLWAELIIK